MKPISLKKRNIIFVLFATAFAIIIPIVFLYALGYRIGDQLSLVRTGGIYVHPWNTRGTVSVNGKPVGETALIGRDYLVQSLRAGTYTVSFTRDGYYPWQKTVSVRRQFVTEISPFIIQEHLTSVAIPKTIPSAENPAKNIPNPLFKSISALFNPPVKKPVVVEELDPARIAAEADGGIGYKKFRKMAIWEKNGSMIAEWTGEHEYIPPYFCNDIACQQTITVLRTPLEADGFVFYPDRNDIVIVSLPDGIYALELDTRGVQNKMLIVSGENLPFRLDGSTLYVKEKADLFQKISLE